MLKPDGTELKVGDTVTTEDLHKMFPGAEGLPPSNTQLQVKEALFKIWNLAGAPHWTSVRRWEIEALARDAYRALEEQEK